MSDWLFCDIRNYSLLKSYYFYSLTKAKGKMKSIAKLQFGNAGALYVLEHQLN